MIGYINGRYLPKEEITISPEDRGFLFADGLYEVIRSYKNKLFRVHEHLNRLSYGAQELSLNTTNFDYLSDVAKNLIKKNELNHDDAIIYIQVTRGVAPRIHHFPSPNTPLTVYATANPFKPHISDIEEGISCILVPDQRWTRCDIKTICLTANILANQQAKESNVFEALFVRDGVVLEGSHSNFLAVFDGEVTTSPKTNYILGGITRQAVLDLCKDLSIPVRERPIFETEINHADELIIVGTTVEITPILRINGNIVGKGKPGLITRRLQKGFRDLVL